MKSLIYRARTLLILLGKIMPFFFCAIVMLSFAETAVSLLSGHFVAWGDNIIPHKPISWLIAQYFEYTFSMWLVLCIISIAIETCIYNKAACAYLGFNLFEKSLFDFPMDTWLIYAVCALNIIIASYLTYKGVTTFYYSRYGSN